jgi:hypothetical protein
LKRNLCRYTKGLFNDEDSDEDEGENPAADFEW